MRSFASASAGLGIVVGTLLVWPFGGCVTRRDHAEALGREIAASRDRGSHPGPRFDQLPPQLVRAVAEARDTESTRQALVRLLDQLDDGHARVELADFVRLAEPQDVAVVRLGGACWIGNYPAADVPADMLNWCPRPLAMAPSRGTPRDWMRIDRIDGYAPRRPQAVRALLMGPAGTTVRVEGTRADGSATQMSLVRGEAETMLFVGNGELDPMADQYAGMIGFRDPLPEFLTRPSPPEGPPMVEAARLGSDGRVGYVRLAALDMQERCRRVDCASDPCPARQAIDSAIERLFGCDTIMLDIAGNGGGRCSHAGEVLRRLLPRSLDRVPMVHGHPDDEGLDAERWQVEPKERRFAGRLIVLVDEGTASAAEHLAAILKGAPGVTLVGSPTGGSEYSVRRHAFPGDGLVACFGGGATVWDPPFRSAEGRPVMPDIQIPLDGELLASSGPPAAVVQQRIDTLAAAWREAGLLGPESGIWSDLSSGVPWRIRVALATIVRRAAVLASAAALVLVIWLVGRSGRGSPRGGGDLTAGA